MCRHLHNQCEFSVCCEYLRCGTCAAVESQLGGGVKLLDEELRQRYSVIRVQGLVAFLPVQHQVVVCVCVWRGERERGAEITSSVGEAGC